ncbi:universal stress protein [Nesterenkonia muleiensis]|uniref:universal stress protein n=1 Tax=Nesterenkonia muleiensis TaxID=2282648 RepID=UPI000E719100|nr:universal stress protein [Nesterenkonia muleiensis]
MNNDVRSQVSAPQGTIPFAAEDRELGVLVGFDGSKHAFLALHYAARAAQRGEVPLTVVSAYTIPVGVYTALAALPDAQEARVKSQIAQSTLDEAREYLKDYPGKVTYRAEGGDAAGVLVELSERAQLVVVGARGRGGFFGRLLGSVSSALPAHAKCPTVVVPRHYSVPDATGPERFAPMVSDAPVVAGIDGSHSSRLAALIAAQAAEGRGVALQLLVALPPVDRSLMWYPDLVLGDEELVERRKAELSGELRAEVDWVQGHFPDLEINAVVEVGEATAVLSAATRTAQLTVVGTRGRGGLASSLLGSVSRSALYNAEGPVMVVPDIEDSRLEDQPELW